MEIRKSQRRVSVPRFPWPDLNGFKEDFCTADCGGFFLAPKARPKVRIWLHPEVRAAAMEVRFQAAIRLRSGRTVNAAYRQ